MPVDALGYQSDRDNRSHTHNTMTEQTKRALLELSYALSQDKDARKALKCYGDLPEHLHDAVIDLMANGDL